MIEPINCPICWDVIEVNRNCTTTDCGHCFHTICLMQNVAHNGFGCPYCRAVMTEKTDEEAQYQDTANQDNVDWDWGTDWDVDRDLDWLSDAVNWALLPENPNQNNVNLLPENPTARIIRNMSENRDAVNWDSLLR
jgi:hypothetical protein